MAEPVALDVLARRAPGWWAGAAATMLLGVLLVAFGLLLLWLGLSGGAWTAAAWAGFIGLAGFACLGWSWMALRRLGTRGPVLAIRPQGLTLPVHKAGRVRAPTRLRWSEVESITLAGPARAPRLLVLTLTAEASRLRGVSVDHLPDDVPHRRNRARIRLDLIALSEPAPRILAALHAAAAAAGVSLLPFEATRLQAMAERVSGPAQRWKALPAAGSA